MSGDGRSLSVGRAGSIGVGGVVAGADIASSAMICTLPRWYGMGSSEMSAGSSPVRCAIPVTIALRRAGVSTHSTPIVRKPAPSWSGIVVPPSGECLRSTR